MEYIAFVADVQPVQAGKLRDALTRASNAGQDIYLIISSGGGNVFEGLSLGAFMKTLPVKITTHNIGQVDSIANLIFSAGTMHYERMDFVESQLEDQYKGLVKMRQDITAAISAYSGLSLTDVETLMISGTTILTANEALSKNIIHEIRNAAIPPGSQVIAIGNV